MRFLFGEFTFDAERLELRRGGERVEAQPKVLQVLLYLLHNADRTVSKRELLDGVWADSATAESSLTRAISLARKLVGKDVIENVRGMGYRIAVSIEHAGATVTSRPVEVGAAGFVGRRRERDTIDRWRGSAESTGVVGLLRGEPGIGKTRLAREFTFDARRAGARVVWGAAVEGAPRAYGAWRPILAALLDRDHAPSSLQTPRGAVAVIAETIDEVRTRLPDLQRPAFAAPTSARPRFVSAVVETLEAHASRQPLVVVIDDVQWLDTSSTRLLEEAIRETATSPVLWLLIARRTSQLAGRPIEELLAEWRQDVRVLELAGLDAPTVSSLVDQLGADDLSAERITALHDRTGGNPLFVEQLVRAGLAEGAPHSPDARLERESLRGLTGVVRGRLETLPAECVRLLEIGAVFGRAVPIGLLSDVSNIDELDVLDLLEPAERAELIVTEQNASAFVFDHELIRETLVSSLAAGARARCHKAIAEALERRLPHQGAGLLPTLAWHYGRCISRTTAKRAVDYAIRAARHEMESLAFESAVVHYRDALRAGERIGVGDEGDRAGLMLELATALFHGGDPVEAERAAWRAIELARRRGDLRIWALAAVAMSEWVLHRSGQVPHDRIASLEAILEELPDEEYALRAQVLMALSQDLHWSGESERTTALGFEAVQAARATGDPLALCQAVSAAFHVAWDPADPARRDALVDEEVALAWQTGDTERLCLAHHHRFATLVERGERERALADLRVADEMGRRLRRLRYLHAIHARAANVATLSGRFDEAEALCAEADALRRHRSEDIGFLVGAAQQFTLARLRGRLEAWTDILRAGVVAYPDVAGFAAAACLMSYELGDHARARSELSRFWRGDELLLRRDMQLILNLVHVSEVAAELGTESQVLRCYSLLRPCDGRIAVLESITAAGSVSRVLGLLAARLEDLDAAEAHLRSGIEVERRLDAGPWEAYSSRDLATLLRRRGHLEEASRWDARARELALGLGMPQLY